MNVLMQEIEERPSLPIVYTHVRALAHSRSLRTLCSCRILKACLLIACRWEIRFFASCSLPVLMRRARPTRERRKHSSKLGTPWKNATSLSTPCISLDKVIVSCQALVHHRQFTVSMLLSTLLISNHVHSYFSHLLCTVL